MTLLGRNGAGKTTTLRAIMGIVPQRQRLGRSFAATRSRRLALEPDRPARHRLLPGGARHLCQPRCRGEPAAAADGAPGRDERRRDLRDLSQPRGAPAQPGHQALRRRAADAGDRPDPAHRRHLCLLLDEPTEGLAPVIVQQIGAVIRTLEAEGLHDPARRAEFSLRRDPRRSPLCRRARPRHRHDLATRISRRTSTSCNNISGLSRTRPGTQATPARPAGGN